MIKLEIGDEIQKIKMKVIEMDQGDGDIYDNTLMVKNEFTQM